MQDRTLVIRDLTKVFPTLEGPVTAVDRVSLDVRSGEFFSLLGPSGCGKTTTLRMIAGLETVTDGTIRFGDRNLATLPSAERNLGMVFQSYALFPHMTVLENAAYGLRVRRSSNAAVKERVLHLLDLLGLGGLHGRYPSDLSGGQQQRVSIARALAYEPDMFLLDEPLANLDAKLRVQMREEIRRIQKELGVLALYVTHDQEEAMSVSDRIGVFRLGRLMQVGVPESIYRDPMSMFVADFIGKINFFPAHVVSQEARGRFRFEGGYEALVHRRHPLTVEEREEHGVRTSAVVAVRPEHLTVLTNGDAGIPARVRRVLFLGSITRYFVTCEGALREVVIDAARPFGGVEEGQGVRLSFAPEDAIAFVTDGGA
jgi:iron(III) transport system ATP-binding protein